MWSRMKQLLKTSVDGNGDIARDSAFRSQRGVTLIEMMLAITIMGIILVLVAPNYKIFIMNNEQVAAMNEFTGFLNFARSEAIKRGSVVTICQSDGGSSCNGTSWNDGWLVFPDDDGSNDRNGSEAVLKARMSMASGFTMTSNGGNRVEFNSRGFTPGFAATFTFCDRRGATGAKASILSITGRVRRAEDSDDNGIVEDGSDVDVSCP